MSVVAVPKFTILSDHYTRKGAAEPGQVDFFALESRLGPMFDVLRHKDTETPLALAIYGSVGTGKTTALNWLVSRVESWNAVPVRDRGGHPHVLPIQFSARRCTAAGSIARTMMIEIMLQTLVGLDRNDAQQRLGRIKKAATLCGGALGPEFIQRLDFAANRWGIMDTWKVSLGNFDSKADTKTAYYDGCLDLVNEWLQQFEAGGSPVRLAIFIDDLDHAKPEVMMEVFDAINLQLRLSRMVFVAALDPQVAKTLIKQHYSKHDYGEVQSRHYLTKVFQLECDIEPYHQQVKEFYDAQYQLLDEKCGHRLSTHLKPEFKEWIDAAILHLSAGNPRKIKLLLNSALMNGYVAIRNRELDAKSDETSALIFAQNVQFYLLQRWLSYFSVGASAIYRDDVLDWFDALSNEARLPTSDYSRIVSPPEGEVDSRTAPAGLGLHIIHEWVWNLLKIPFSKTVPVHTPYESGSPMVAEEMAEELVVNTVEELSTGFKDALAATLEKAVADMSAGDVVKITDLDLTGHKFTAHDTAFLGKLENLERLDVHNSTIATLVSLEGLSKLKSLNLSCTLIADIAPLGSITELEVLDLSFSQVHDLSPLKGNQVLTSLVLYGTPVKDISALLDMPKLARLNLSCTEVGDEQVDVIKTLKALNTLFLRQTKVTSAGAAELNKAFEFNLKIDR